MTSNRNQLPDLARSASFSESSGDAPLPNGSSNNQLGHTDETLEQFWKAAGFSPPAKAGSIFLSDVRDTVIHNVGMDWDALSVLQKAKIAFLVLRQQHVLLYKHFSSLSSSHHDDQDYGNRKHHALRALLSALDEQSIYGKRLAAYFPKGGDLMMDSIDDDHHRDFLEKFKIDFPEWGRHLPQRPGGSVSHDDPKTQVKIRNKQQRLLLLHHSAKCPQKEDGSCTVTPHCALMKRLWRHIEGCKDNKCQFEHCVSSRYVLTHYRKCREANCQVCGPVRRVVRRDRCTSLARRPVSRTTGRPVLNQRCALATISNHSSETMRRNRGTLSLPRPGAASTGPTTNQRRALTITGHSDEAVRRSQSTSSSARMGIAWTDRPTNQRHEHTIFNHSVTPVGAFIRSQDGKSAVCHLLVVANTIYYSIVCRGCKNPSTHPTEIVQRYRWNTSRFMRDRFTDFEMFRNIFKGGGGCPEQIMHNILGPFKPGRVVKEIEFDFVFSVETTFQTIKGAIHKYGALIIETFKVYPEVFDDNGQLTFGGDYNKKVKDDETRHFNHSLLVVGVRRTDTVELGGIALLVQNTWEHKPFLTIGVDLLLSMGVRRLLAVPSGQRFTARPNDALASFYPFVSGVSPPRLDFDWLFADDNINTTSEYSWSPLEKAKPHE